MAMIRFFRAAVFLGSLMLVGSCYADYMKCGTHLISDSSGHPPGKYEVLKKCGEPAARYGNTWVYDRSGYQPSTLRFDGAGRLQNIQN